MRSRDKVTWPQHYIKAYFINYYFYLTVNNKINTCNNHCHIIYSQNISINKQLKPQNYYFKYNYRKEKPKLY